MKVIIGIPVLHVGGTEIQTLSLVKVLRAAGFTVSVCCYYEYQERMVRQMEAAGVEVVLLGLSRASGLFGLLMELVRFFKRAAPHVVHIQYVAPGLIPIVAARLAGIRAVFATVHQPGRPYGWRAKLFIRLAARLCNAFFCVSRAVERSWFGDSELLTEDSLARRRKHFTVYNAVDADAIAEGVRVALVHEMRESLDIVGRPVIGVVARLRTEKGVSVLLRALKKITEAIPNVMLLVVGDGTDRGKLVAEANALGVASHIRWLGELGHEEVVGLYGVMDVVAVPSLFEGFGLSAVEAMATRRAVVGTSVDGLKEVVEDGVTGYLVPPGDSGALADALIRVLRDPGLAAEMGARGRVRVSEHFSSAIFAETILVAYRYFLEGKVCSEGAPVRPPRTWQ